MRSRSTSARASTRWRATWRSFSPWKDSSASSSLPRTPFCRRRLSSRFGTASGSQGLPLAAWLALTAVAFRYYATDWWGTVSGALCGVAFLVLVLAWLVLVAALLAGLRAPSPDAA